MLLSMRYADSNGFSAVLIPPYPSNFRPPTALSTLPAGSGQGIWRGCKKPSRRSQEAGNNNHAIPAADTDPAICLAATAIPLFTNRTTIKWIA